MDCSFLTKINYLIDYIEKSLHKYRIYEKDNYTWLNSTETGRRVKIFKDGEKAALQSILNIISSLEQK